MNKIRFIKVLFLLTIVLCYSRQIKAQLAPWVYTGGSGLEDNSNDVMRTPDGDYLAIIQGGEYDTITFSVIRLDENGQLLWFREFSKNNFEERPHNVNFSEDSASVFITGFGNADTSIWGIELDYLTGDYLGSTELWSDAAGSASGLNARGSYTEENAYNIYTYQEGRLIIYKTFEIQELEDSVSFPFPVNVVNEKHIISDCETLSIGQVLTGSYGPNYIPYVWYMSDTDSLYYHEPGIDSVLLNGVKETLSNGWVVSGNTFDSTQIYIAVYDTTGGLHLEFDTLYPVLGYKMVATDVIQFTDGSFFILTIHYDPAGIRTELLHIDAAGNYISEQIILGDAGIIELTNLISAPGGVYPFVLSGSIDTEAPELETEYLIVGSDDSGNFPECIFNCVWPGDANNSGFVDMADLFPLGTGYFLTGPERDIITDTWGGYNADIWPDSTGTDLNAKYADCFGDGLIDENDTTAIINNYALGHEVFNFRLTEGGDFPIWLNTAGIILHSGYNEIPIMLGTEAYPVDEIYGVEFTISYEGAPFIDSNGVTVYFIDSWFGIVEEEMITLNYKPGGESVDAGAVNINYINRSGYGQIGKLGFIVEDNIAGIMIESGDSSIIFNITGATGVLNDLTPVMLDGSAYEVWAATGIHDLIPDENIILYPNPWRGEELKIFPENYLIQNFEKYTLSDITGRIVDEGVINSGVLNIKSANLQSNGSYILKLTGNKFTQQFSLMYYK